MPIRLRVALFGAGVVVLTAPQTIPELSSNLCVLDSPRMAPGKRAKWERFGDLVHSGGSHAFESRWP